jgi:hypothetical protein
MQLEASFITTLAQHLGLCPLRCSPCRGTGSVQAQACRSCSGCGCLWVRPAQAHDPPRVLGHILSVNDVLSRARATGLLQGLSVFRPQ